MTATDNTARIGVDVGGTFTDVILQRADGSATIRKLLSTPPNYDAAVVEAVAGLDERHAGRGRRPRDDRRDERGARAPRRADGARHDGRLPRRARAAPAADPAHVRPVLAQARAARPAPAALRGRRAHDRRRHGAARRSTPTRRARSPARLREAGVESVAVCLLHSYLLSRSTRSGSARSCARSCPASRSRSRARSCASSASTSAPRRRSSTRTCGR